MRASRILVLAGVGLASAGVVTWLAIAERTPAPATTLAIQAGPKPARRAHLIELAQSQPDGNQIQTTEQQEEEQEQQEQQQGQNGGNGNGGNGNGGNGNGNGNGGGR